MSVEYQEMDEEPDIDMEETAPEEEETVAEADNELEEAELAAKNEEELQRKKIAMDSLNSIEKLFAVFRDRLFEERIAALDAEISTLQGARQTHTEYLLIEESLLARRDEKIELEDKMLQYRTHGVTTRSKAERAQIHSQFFQSARQIREALLSTTFEEATALRRGWEGIIPDYFNTFPTKRSDQVLHQMAYNKEVSILAGVAKYRGFPAAPTLWTMKAPEVTQDLKAMGIS